MPGFDHQVHAGFDEVVTEIIDIRHHSFRQPCEREPRPEIDVDKGLPVVDVRDQVALSARHSGGWALPGDRLRHGNPQLYAGFVVSLLEPAPGLLRGADHRLVICRDGNAEGNWINVPPLWMRRAIINP